MFLHFYGNDTWTAFYCRANIFLCQIEKALFVDAGLDESEWITDRSSILPRRRASLSIYVSSLLPQREETTRRDSTAFPSPLLVPGGGAARRDSTAFPSPLSQGGGTARRDSTAFQSPLSQEEGRPGVTVRHPLSPYVGQDVMTNRSDSRPRETSERWPLLTVELRQMGTYGVQMKEVLSWMVLWARAPAQEIFILPWLLWSAQYTVFFSFAAHFHFPSPSKLGRQSCRVTFS